jgi:cytochrome c biogenesis protein CcdA
MPEQIRKDLSRDLSRARTVARFFLFAMTTFSVLLVVTILMVSEGQVTHNRMRFIIIGVVIWMSIVGATIYGLRYRDIKTTARQHQLIEDLHGRVESLEKEVRRLKSGVSDDQTTLIPREPSGFDGETSLDES